MERAEATEQRATTASAAAVPALRPWREVGWIFRDGDCIAIERNGDETRARALLD
jgi:hypothetical protein